MKRRAGERRMASRLVGLAPGFRFEDAIEYALELVVQSKR